MPDANFHALSQEVDRRVAAIRTANPQTERSKAVCAVFTSDPELHRRYLASANTSGPAPTPVSRLSGAAAVAEFEKRVQMMKDGGSTSADAVLYVVKKDPALHAAYVQAKNPGPVSR